MGTLQTLLWMMKEACLCSDLHKLWITPDILWITHPNLSFLGHIQDSIMIVSPLCLFLGGHPMSKRIEYISILQAITTGFKIYMSLLKLPKSYSTITYSTLKPISLTSLVRPLAMQRKMHS